MRQGIAIGQYYPGASGLHRLDPRAKLTALLFYMAALFLADGLWAYGLLAAVGLALLLFSRVPPSVFFRSLRLLFLLIAFAALFHIFFTPGETVGAWGPIKISREGLWQAGFMAARLLLLVGAASLLTFTTTPVALTDGIERMLRPLQALGFPGHELAMMMSIALRFIPTIMEEAEKVRKAQMARGIVLGIGSLKETAKAALPFMVPLFAAAFRRADELAYAMEARAYRGGVGRTTMKALRLAAPDVAAMALMALLALAMAYLRWFS